VTSLLVKSPSKKLIRTCSIWRALEVIGDTPSLLVLEAIWLGERRFGDIRERTGLHKALLSDRLKRLTAADLLEKRVSSPQGRRSEYGFLKKGADLLWVALMLLRWERRWAEDPERVSVVLQHHETGHIVKPEPICGACGAVFGAKDVDWQEGPGLGWMTPTYRRRRHQKPDQTPQIYSDSAELMGDRWSALILRSVLTGLIRFHEILDDTGMATNVLTQRLQWLREKGILRSRVYQTHPERLEYCLTEKGADYFPVLVMLQLWGDRYYPSPLGPPVLLFHKLCGNPLSPKVGSEGMEGPLSAAALRVTTLWPKDETY